MHSYRVVWSLLFLVLAQVEYASAEIGPLLGGSASVYDDGPKAYSREIPQLDIRESRAFNRGRALFRDPWVLAPASTSSRDGLGPLFNGISCDGCHREDGRGRPPEKLNGMMRTMLVRLSIPGEGPHGEPVAVPNYGGQLQNMSIPGVKREGQARISLKSMVGYFDDGTSYELIRPEYRFDELAYGPLPKNVLFSPRVASAMIGLGLLEAISEEEILSWQDSDDQDGDGISGRANWVWDQERKQLRLGRFGWKANQPSLRQQTAGAFLGDIGVSSSIFPQSVCAASQKECLAAPDGAEAGEPELLDSILEDVSFYSASLAVPVRRNIDDPKVKRGEELFFIANCHSCHRVAITTGKSSISDALSHQKIHPFTDLLLHDMGSELADKRPDFKATGSEWRTPPLWGIGLSAKVNGHTRFLHDGRARNISEAILWHGGEGEAAKKKYKSMNASDREALLAFLESL